MDDINIIMMDTSKLVPYENNPRNNDDAVEYVANSIKEFGFKVPIIVDSKNVIVAGHTRMKAAQLLGMSQVPCIIADDLTDEQVKAFRLADNKVAEFSEWDEKLLQVELDGILDTDMGVFGFKLEECPLGGGRPYIHIHREYTAIYGYRGTTYAW